jgi:hypothetical protein
MTSERTAQLLPCPFCGMVVNRMYAKRDLIWIEHQDADADCPIADGLWASEEQWNTRPARGGKP